MNENQRFHFGRAQVHFQRGHTSHALRHLRLSGGNMRFGTDPIGGDVSDIDITGDNTNKDPPQSSAHEFQGHLSRRHDEKPLGMLDDEAEMDLPRIPQPLEVGEVDQSATHFGRMNHRSNFAFGECRCRGGECICRNRNRKR